MADVITMMPTLRSSYVPRNLSKHCSNRLFEWMAACMMMGISATIEYSPHTIPAGGLHLMQDIGLTREALIIFFSIASALRIGALFANGRLPVYGPRCRALCALAGALVWAQMCLSLVKWSSEVGYVSLGVPVYLFLTVGELISCYRAATDGRSG